MRGLRLGTASLALGAFLAALAMAQPSAALEDETSRKATNVANGQKAAKAVTETEIVAGRDERPMLSLGSVFAMEVALARYQAIVANGGWPEVVSAKFKVGREHKDAVPLKRRLAAEGFYPAEHADNPLVTENMLQALRQFQINYGLAATGKLDKATLAALNVPAYSRLATLRANLPRMAEYSRDLGPRYIVVNIPALQLEAVNGTEVFSRHNIIVGKPDRPSPVVMTHLSDINFNPYWNAPVSIVEKDIIPEIRRKGIGVLKKMGIRIFDGYNGPEVDPNTVDWQTVAAKRYFFRQDPGEENAMAAVKINFPSPFHVYMHDTPTRNLFTTAARYVSSGCVRVDKVEILVDWILNGQDGWDSARIAEMAKSGERLDVKLVDPPQIRWVYLTAWTSSDGRVNFRNDIYSLDGTGFVVGQPTPVGEFAADGQRFMLTPPPLKPTAAAAPVEAPAIASASETVESDPPESKAQEAAPQDTKKAQESEPPEARKSFGKKLTEETGESAKPKASGGGKKRKTAARRDRSRPKAKTNFNKPPASAKPAAALQRKKKPLQAEGAAATPKLVSQ